MVRYFNTLFILTSPTARQIDAVALLDVFLTLLKGPALQQNKKDALSALSLLIQLSPVQLWGEAMHKSGLFPYLLDIFMMDKVYPSTCAVVLIPLMLNRKRIPKFFVRSNTSSRALRCRTQWRSFS